MAWERTRLPKKRRTRWDGREGTVWLGVAQGEDHHGRSQHSCMMMLMTTMMMAGLRWASAQSPVRCSGCQDKKKGTGSRIKGRPTDDTPICTDADSETRRPSLMAPRKSESVERHACWVPSTVSYCAALCSTMLHGMQGCADGGSPAQPGSARIRLEPPRSSLEPVQRRWRLQKPRARRW